MLDAQEDDYEDALPRLAETISVAVQHNSSMNFEVFLHKVTKHKHVMYSYSYSVNIYSVGH